MNAACRTRKTAGYTLVEMLLATALSVTLLAALWSLFGIYTELFDEGQATVEHSQLCRALMQQMSDDLRAAIQDPIGGSTARSEGTAPVRRFGLLGSQHELRFDVLQVTPEQGNPTPVGRSWTASGDFTEVRVPELRTVYYSFASQSTMDGMSRSGLLRRELDFETPVSPESEDSYDGLASDLLGDFAADDAQTGGPAIDPADVSVMWVPEVVSAEFRYFDGNGWTNAWDSLQRKSLPVAVEVVLQIVDPNDLSEDQPAAEEEALTEEHWMALDAAVTRGVVYRLIVDLPGSPTYRKPRPPERVVIPPPQPAVAPPPVRLAPRRIAPPRPTPTKPPVHFAPEEWIRTQSR